MDPGLQAALDVDGGGGRINPLGGNKAERGEAPGERHGDGKPARPSSKPGFRMRRAGSRARQRSHPSGYRAFLTNFYELSDCNEAQLSFHSIGEEMWHPLVGHGELFHSFSSSCSSCRHTRAIHFGSISRLLIRQSRLVARSSRQTFDSQDRGGMAQRPGLMNSGVKDVGVAFKAMPQFAYAM